MKKGFTLVELAIVLVIVGLIIGGILVAQGMMSTARITAQIKQLEQFDIATRNFISNYNYLPGDYIPLGSNSSGHTGDSNGHLNVFNYANDPPSTYSTWGETYAFFPSLYKAGMIKDLYDTIGTAYYVAPGSPFPKAAMAKQSNFGIAATGNISGQVFWDLAVSAPIGDTTHHAFDSMSPSGIFSPSDGLALDAKIDDAVPGTGNVVAIASNNLCNSVIADYFGTICKTVSGIPYPISLDPGSGALSNTLCVQGSAPYKYKTSTSSDTACRLLVKSDATP